MPQVCPRFAHVKLQRVVKSSWKDTQAHLCWPEHRSPGRIGLSYSSVPRRMHQAAAAAGESSVCDVR